MNIDLFSLLLFLIFINHGPVKCNKGKDPTGNKFYFKLLWVILGCEAFPVRLSQYFPHFFFTNVILYYSHVIVCL